MRKSDVPVGEVGQWRLSAIDFLESLFPQIQRSELLQLLQSYNDNVTDVVNHMIQDDSKDDTDEIDTLVQLFPSSSSSQIQNAWIESNGNVHVAAQYLCEQVSDCKINDLSGAIEDTIQEEDESNHIYVLLEMFPDHSVEFLSSILHDHGLDKGISLLLKLDQACNGDCINTGFPCLLHSSENCNSSYYSSSSVEVSQSKLGKNKTNFQFILPPISRSIEAASHIRLDENEISKGSVYLRKMAQNARQSRNEAYQKASSTWKSNDLTRKGSASYYGVQGRSFHDEFCKWNTMAVEALLRENSRSEGVLDLHGFTVQEAIQVLPRKIQEWRNTRQKKFKIIVGRGNRSLSGSKLGPAVKKWLSDNNIKHESEPGSFSLVL